MDGQKGKDLELMRMEIQTMSKSNSSLEVKVRGSDWSTTSLEFADIKIVCPITPTGKKWQCCYILVHMECFFSGFVDVN